jgi:4-amino-4-deoxy-L-arabinose transferase-like glycosyltransferase
VGNGIPSARAVAAAAVLLFTPRGFFVIEAGWIEPMVILTLAMVVFCACRRGRVWGIGLAVSFGLLLASKQYLALALPLVLLIPADRFEMPRHLIGSIALLVAVAVTLPLAAWDAHAFMHSAVTLQFHQPFRTDALSYLVRFAGSDGSAPPVWIAFACAAVAGLLALWRCPRTASGFAIAVAIVFFAFFATSKQAFCNYYAFVLAAMCCGLAALPGNSPSSTLR